MCKQRAVTLCSCLAALPLLFGCAGGAGGPPQAYYLPPQVYYAPAQEYYAPPPAPAMAVAPADTGGSRVYTVASGTPAAILVMLPGAGDMIGANPQLWAAQGFDAVAPTASDIDRIFADQQAAAARLIAEAQALANAPVWLVGSGPAIEAAMAALPPGAPGQVSGVVVTSTRSGAGTCNERMIYSYSGSGAPKVSVSKSGDACPPGAPFGGATTPAIISPSETIAPPAPAVQPNRPRVIEATAPAAGTPAARIRELAELIKSPPG
jgi:hypothetical protein